MDHPLKGKKQSAEHVAKRMAAWAKSAGPEKSRAHCLSLVAAQKGKKQTEESNKKRSESMIGKRNSLGTVRGEEFRRKLSEYWAENKERHNHYIDGKSSERVTGRINEMGRLNYRFWRESVFKRDSWKCQWCHDRGYLHAHHIKPYAKNPEHRYDVDNGITVCRGCHYEIHRMRA